MSKRLHATVLVENSPTEGLLSEHGLSVFIEHDNTRVLLDFGQSDAFARNAHDLGIDLAQVDHAVLSHAHYDHTDGMAAFVRLNDHAQIHLSSACAEHCWSTKGGSTEPHYIGIKAGYLERFNNQLSPVSIRQTTTIAPGISVVPHATSGLAALGAQAGMLVRTDEGLRPDDFSHEISLVCELSSAPAGDLAVFSSCSHAGLPAIVHEVQTAFPSHRIAAFVGGLHLVHADDADILRTAHEIARAGIGCVYTGHCTGEHAVQLLARELPGRIVSLQPGLSISL